MDFSLPAEIVLAILSLLDTTDVFNFRQCSKASYELSKSRTIWDSLIRSCIIEEEIPLPGLAGRSLESLDARELESLHCRALQLHRNWHSEFPVIKQSFRLSCSTAQIVRLFLLPSRDGGRWLVTLEKFTQGSGKCMIRCWDLRQAKPVCVARRDFDRIGGMAVNKSGHEIAALTSRGIEVMAISLANPNEGLVTSKTISAPMASLHYFQDKRIITSDSTGRVFLLHVDHPQVKIEFQHNRERDWPLDLVLTDTFILILKRRTLELYPLLSLVATLPRHIIIPPIFVYRWLWLVDFGAMALRPLLGVKSMNDPITVFVRFRSFTLPWSNNSIHQYEVRPNLYFIGSEPPSELNVPYEYPPLLTGTIAGPVRLSAKTDLALGAYGTAVWLDNHTEIYYQASRGQRIAGTFARVERRTLDLDQSGEEGGTPIPSDNLENIPASFEFAHQHEESWTKLMVDEEEGVIFVGGESGVIDMFRYDTFQGPACYYSGIRF